MGRRLGLWISIYVQGSESDDFAYNDFGEQTWTNYNGEEETRSFDFKFDENWNLISGTETMDDGSTITFGANWEIVSETRTVNLEADNIVALTDEQKAESSRCSGCHHW